MYPCLSECTTISTTQNINISHSNFYNATMVLNIFITVLYNLSLLYIPLAYCIFSLAYCIFTLACCIYMFKFCFEHCAPWYRWISWQTRLVWDLLTCNLIGQNYQPWYKCQMDSKMSMPIISSTQVQLIRHTLKVIVINLAIWPST